MLILLLYSTAVKVEEFSENEDKELYELPQKNNNISSSGIAGTITSKYI